MPDRKGDTMRFHDPDSARIQFAAACFERHTDREYYFLDLAVRAADDDSSLALEVCADEAYRDAIAIAEEHGLRP